MVPVWDQYGAWGLVPGAWRLDPGDTEPYLGALLPGSWDLRARIPVNSREYGPGARPWKAWLWYTGIWTLVDNGPDGAPEPVLGRITTEVEA